MACSIRNGALLAGARVSALSRKFKRLESQLVIPELIVVPAELFCSDDILLAAADLDFL